MSKIYFIGGAPRSGKTTVIQRLIENKPMLAASTDAIRNVAKGVTSAKSRPKLHKIGHGVSDSERDMEIMRNDPQTLLKHEIYQSEEVWKSTLDFIGYYQRDGKDAVIEGVAVLPKELVKVNFDYKAVFLISKDDQSKAILKHARENEHDWLHDYSDEGIESFCKFLKHWNDYYANEAQRHGFTVVEIDSGDFDASIDSAVNTLLEN